MLTMMMIIIAFEIFYNLLTAPRTAVYTTYA